ncbi:MAG: prealbumin-like fold domain-containing protein [Thomasclavelia ramosa]
MIRKVSSLDHNTGLYKAEFKLLDADKKVIDEGIESNGQGYVIFTGLTPGATYYYVETKAPDGYTLNTTEYSFTAPQVNDTNNSLVYESKEIVEMFLKVSLQLQRLHLILMKLSLNQREI